MCSKHCSQQWTINRTILKVGIQCLRCSRCLKTKTIDICFIRTVEKIRFINYFQSKIPTRSWWQMSPTKNNPEMSPTSHVRHQHLYNCPMISSIFLFTFDCLNCITGWPWLYLGLNQQTNSYFIDNLRDDPGDIGQTVMFMIQATDIHLFTVLMLRPPYSNTQHNILTVSIWHFGHVLSSSEFKFLQWRQACLPEY